ncbi:hypothetical protein LCGC14_2076100 [marine sediment metagenome]|uniref:Uncharacterized protein n=1 Tax=marine sediment metagenome TaxID=412755 RepID=A0A0F9GVD1_9ZZZZ
MSKLTRLRDVDEALAALTLRVAELEKRALKMFLQDWMNQPCYDPHMARSAIPFAGPKTQAERLEAIVESTATPSYPLRKE